MKVKEEVAKRLEEKLQGELERRKILLMLEKPKYADMGDLAFPCFELAKVFRKSPQKIASELAGQIKDPIVEKVEAVSGYVNVFLNKKMVANEVISDVIELNENYGSINIGNAETMIIDFSSPNIAKPFSMGHLRSTVIGQSLSLIAEKRGYKTVKINHIGDWGTQFGKLIVAYRLWGDEAKVKQDPIKELLKLYVQFHEEAEKNPTLNDQGREWFRKLEHGNEEALKL